MYAGGTLTRLVLRIANGGQLEYPLPGDVSLSVLGQVPVATTRVYQGWYRDSSLGYCKPGTFNLENTGSGGSAQKATSNRWIARMPPHSGNSATKGPRQRVTTPSRPRDYMFSFDPRQTTFERRKSSA